MLYASGVYSGDYVQAFGLSGFNDVRASLTLKKALMPPLHKWSLATEPKDTQHELP